MPLTPDQLIGLIVATSFAAGLNVYATVATLGLLSRSGAIALPGSLGLVDNWWVIGACIALFAIEFVADKVPAFDLIWNALQTFVRVPAGALLAYAAASPLGPGWQLLATALGATIAFAAHGGKTAARVAVTTSPEPFSNAALSFAEDAFAIFLTWFATRHPFIAAAIVAVCLVVIVLLIRLIIAALRAMFQGAEAQLQESGQP
jgi:Domain of unknown function (DUF4126)